jgi:cell fate regulator YaaT (PSP1 superfamily)
MSEIKEQQAEESSRKSGVGSKPSRDGLYYYRIRFRDQGQEFTARSSVSDFANGDVIFTKTEHGPEPAAIISRAAGAAESDMKRGFSYDIIRRATQDEKKKYEYLPVLEKQAAVFCRGRIEKHSLSIKLVRAERFFNRYKVIFYFTAETRVDFR